MTISERYSIFRRKEALSLIDQFTGGIKKLNYTQDDHRKYNHCISVANAVG